MWNQHEQSYTDAHCVNVTVKVAVTAALVTSWHLAQAVVEVLAVVQASQMMIHLECQNMLL